MIIRVQKRLHPRYKWEVLCPKKVFGKRIRKPFKTKADAEREKAKLMAKYQDETVAPLDPDLHLLLARFQNKLSVDQIESALLAKLEEAGESTISFKEACARHLEHLKRMQKRDACGAEHVRDFRVRMPKIDDWLGNPDLKDIDKALLEEFVDDQLEMPGHKGMKSPRTVKNYMAQISAVINWAIEQGWTTKNVTKEIKLGRYKPEVHILKPGEVSKLLTNADWAMRAWIMFGAFGGCRSSEIRLLRWEDVRLEDNQFYIPGKKNVCAERWVTLTPPLRDYCEQMLTPPANAEENWKREGLIMRGMYMSSIIRRREKLFKKAGLSIPRNALRHSFGSHHLVEYGNPMVTAAEMGHYSPQTTFAYYRKAVRASQAEKFWAVRAGAELEEAL